MVLHTSPRNLMKQPPILVTITAPPGLERARAVTLVKYALDLDGHSVHFGSQAQEDLNFYDQEVREYQPVSLLIDCRSPMSEPERPISLSDSSHPQNQKVGLIGCGMILAFILLLFGILAFISRLPAAP